MSKISLAVAFYLSVSVCAANSSYADTNAVLESGETIPAQFSDGPRSLQNVVKFPDLPAEGDVYREIPCVATIRPGGKLQGSACFVEKDDAFRRAVSTAVRSSSINPLILDGRAVRLDSFHFTVVFERVAGVESISAYPYHRMDESDWDPNYRGAQRYFLGRWSFLWCAGGTRSSSSRTNVIAAVELSAQGVATNPSIIDGRTPCTKNIFKVLSDSHYIPAHSSGQPVASIYVERFVFNPSN